MEKTDNKSQERFLKWFLLLASSISIVANAIIYYINLTNFCLYSETLGFILIKMLKIFEKFWQLKILGLTIFGKKYQQNVK